jgi:hypothetical protein
MKYEVKYQSESLCGSREKAGPDPLCKKTARISKAQSWLKQSWILVFVSVFFVPEL